MQGGGLYKSNFYQENIIARMIMRRRLACCTRDMRDMSIDFDEQESNILSHIHILFMKNNNDKDRFCDDNMSQLNNNNYTNINSTKRNRVFFFSLFHD